MTTPVTPVTTLFPVSGCFASCGKLYDVNGACVPPIAATADVSVYNACFCGDSRLAPFSTGTAGVCDGSCTDANGLASVQSWYTSLCAGVKQADGTGATTTTTSGAASGTAKSSTSSGSGGSWISNHYQWIIFLVIMILAIVGLWVGACIWRKKYLAKRDRQYALGKNLARATESGRIVPNASQAHSIHVPSSSMFQPAPISAAGVYDEEKIAKSRNKWTVDQRT